MKNTLLSLSLIALFLTVFPSNAMQRSTKFVDLRNLVSLSELVKQKQPANKKNRDKRKARNFSKEH